MSTSRWSLEVVRGNDVGRTYALRPGETTLGNAPVGPAPLDLAGQEGSGPRRMAASHAAIACTAGALVLRDLESPGGTFVNRQRVLAGQTRKLEEGDVIQLASVQLRVVAAPAEEPLRPPPAPVAGARNGESRRAAPAKPHPVQVERPPAPTTQGPVSPAGALRVPYALPGGPACRTWDDFLTVSSQRWVALREELTSGRLGAFLASAHHPALAPQPDAAADADEQLDAWLGRLPTTRPSAPELAVHPERLVVRATGGGVRRQTVQVTNVGYRLLRSTARIEPPSTAWARVAAEFAGRSFTTLERTDLPIDVHIPDVLDGPLTSTLVVESNGGTARVEVRLERPPAAPIPTDVGPQGEPAAEWGLGAALARFGVGGRLALGVGGFATLRLVMGLGGRLSAGRWPTGSSLPLAGPGLVLAVLCGLIAAARIVARGERRDVASGAFAAGFGGLLLASVGVAACRVMEPPLGGLGGAAFPAALILWAGLGAVAAGLSLWSSPPSTPEEASP